MKAYRKHIFVCENRRDPESGRSSCGVHDSGQIRAELKRRITELGLNDQIRINKAGCLGACEQGPSMVIYPQGIWYGHVSNDDIDEILERSILRNELIDRLVSE